MPKELTKEQIEESIKNRECPYCKDSERRFIIKTKTKVVECTACGVVLIPSESWLHWVYGDTEEQIKKKIKEEMEEEKYKYCKERKEEMEGEVADHFGMNTTKDGKEYLMEYVELLRELKEG